MTVTMEVPVDVEKQNEAPSSSSSEGEEARSRCDVRGWNRVLWQGGSLYDAWCNAVTVQVGQVILSMPYSYAQVGFAYGVLFQLVYLIVGWWTCYLLACLYLEHRKRKELAGVKFKKHMIQYNEVIGGLCGPWAGKITIFFDVMSMGSISVAQIIACASNAYYINPNLNKRDWTFVFGGMALLTVLFPTLSEFRLWAVLGVATTGYTAWYMVIASLVHGQQPNVVHQPPKDLRQFFTGATNMLYAYGGHAITVDIMHSMYKPEKYKYVYLFNCLFVLSITTPHSVCVYWAYGNELLHKANALGILPSSPFRTVGLIFMIIHQAVAFGLYVMPLNFMWEKLWGLHEKAGYLTRILARLPVPFVLVFLALLLPFFGPLNSVIGSIFLGMPVFVIPPLAYLYTYRSKEAREEAADKPYKWLSWKLIAPVNLLIAFAVVVLGMGFGGWASISSIIKQLNTFGIFEKCYQCSPNSTVVSH